MDDEREAVEKEFGRDFVSWDEEEKEFRTAVKDGHCVFLENNACSIHSRTYYPIVCRGYPFRNLYDTRPYEFEIECPDSSLSPLLDPATKRLKILSR